jgi:hypothetical protein
MRKLLAVAMLLATPAVACDPDELERAMTEICSAATAGAAEAVEAALPLARPGEATSLEAQLTALRRLCMEGDPAQAARDAARLARLAGRIEARADQPRPASF